MLRFHSNKDAGVTCVKFDFHGSSFQHSRNELILDNSKQQSAFTMRSEWIRATIGARLAGANYPVAEVGLQPYPSITWFSGLLCSLYYQPSTRLDKSKGKSQLPGQGRQNPFRSILVGKCTDRWSCSCDHSLPPEPLVLADQIYVNDWSASFGSPTSVTCHETKHRALFAAELCL